MTLTQPNNITQTVAAGKVLTVTVAAVSAGNVVRLAASVGGAPQGITAISAGGSSVFGPYPDTERFLITCTEGSLDYSLSNSDITASLAAVTDGAPGALDTLNELAAALGDDPNYAATITTLLALKAPLLSPTLTGTPLAPTATPGTNTTQIASTAFATAAIAAAVLALDGGAPAALNTLDELAAAIGDDAAFATTVATALALKAPLASPVFTGSVPIPGTVTNDNAAAGKVGEQIASVIAVGDAVPLTTATPANVTSISLTAGDWEVEGAIDFILAGVTGTNYKGGASGTTATLGGQDASFSLPLITTTLSDTLTLAIPKQRFSLAGTTTVYLVAQGTFAAGTLTAYGTLRARRIR